MSLSDVALRTIDGGEATLADHAGQVLLLVNLASKCGYTPQYVALEQLQKEYGDSGFSVLGFPCNQFGAQEAGSNEEIAQFCSMTYGVTFPLFDKVEVNGPGRHPLYAILTETPDAEGLAGDVEWNFEKFLVGPDGAVVSRFRPETEPHDPAVIAAIEALLP